jgi:POT family proton-dependent oligopeptide transporter
VPAPVAPASQDTCFFGHPRGLSTLFFTELWERFSFYGMRAILILFMTAPLAAGGLAFDTAKAGVIYGAYTALVYMVALPGGWLADRFLGQRRATLYGGIVIMSGHLSLAVPTLASFYLGLALLVVGTGLLKPNISTMVGQLYAPEDARRDAGFSIYYMGINIGAFLAPLACGWLGQSQQFRDLLSSAGIEPGAAWHFGFGLAAIGMFIGLLQYLRGGKHLGAAGLEPIRPSGPGAEARQRRQLALGLLVALAAIGVPILLSATGAVAITAEAVAGAFGWVLLATVAGLFGWIFLSASWAPAERRRLTVILVLFVGAAVFCAVFEQAGSTHNLFSERSTDATLLGMSFPTTWLLSLNSLFIIALAPAFAWLWVRLGSRDPSSPAKFAVGLLFAGLGFAILIAAARLASAGVKVSPLWLVATYFLHTVGELCLSPVGLSAMTRLAPARVAGLMMGVWFLAASVGNYLGGQLASLYESLSLPALFGAVTAFALAAALLLALLVRPIEWMLGNHGMSSGSVGSTPSQQSAAKR